MSAKALWDKQDWESDLEFKIFRRWLMMGLNSDEERDVHEAYRLETGKTYTKEGQKIVAPNMIMLAYRGMTDYQIAHDIKVSWTDRARAFDIEQARLDTFRWSKRRNLIRHKEYNIAELLLSKAKEMLDYPIYKDEIEEDGKTILRNPAKWGVRDIQAMVAIASQLYRLSAEMEQSIQKLVISFSPDAMRAIDELEKYGVGYSEIVNQFEQILIEAAKKYADSR